MSFSFEVRKGLFASVEIIKPHAGRSKAESHCVRGAVALLGDNQFSDIFFVVRHAVAFLRSLVDLGPIDECHHVGVLFERA